MKRRTFIAGVGTTTTLFLAGCDSSGSDTGPSNETSSGETTTGTGGTTTGTGSTSTTKNSAGETTTATETTTDSETTTTSDETTTDSSGTTTEDSKTVSFGEHAQVSDSLSVAVTEADTSDSYDHGGTTEQADDDSTFLLVTFEAKNDGGSSRSLPDDASLTLHANGNKYDMTDSATSAWKEYVSSGVNGNGSSSTTVAFDVPKDALATLGVTVTLSYTDSGSKKLIRWSME